MSIVLKIDRLMTQNTEIIKQATQDFVEESKKLQEELKNIHDHYHKEMLFEKH